MTINFWIAFLKGDQLYSIGPFDTTSQAYNFGEQYIKHFAITSKQFGATMAPERYLKEIL